MYGPGGRRLGRKRRMNFDGFAERAARTESLSGDHETTEAVAELLCEADETDIVARFVQGRVFPAWDDTKLDVGPSILYDAVALAGGTDADKVERRVAEEGDVGEVAAQVGRGDSRPSTPPRRRSTAYRRRYGVSQKARARGARRRKNANSRTFSSTPRPTPPSISRASSLVRCVSESANGR